MGFPFFSHRTQKEVTRTEELLVLKAQGRLPPWGRGSRTLTALLRSAKINNPPDPNPPGGVA